MTTNIYILKLKDGNYYVGKTNNVEKRFLEHMSGKGSVWTIKYEPIEIEKVIPNSSPFDEDRYVKEYMYKFGFNKVRGGTYVTEKLDESQEYNLKKEIWGANDCCTLCGRKGHFVKDCKEINDVYGDNIFIYECDYCKKEFEIEIECQKHEISCKNKKQYIKPQHTKPQYNQKTNYKNTIINSSSDDSSSEEEYINNKVVCFKCKKFGHYATNCYSTQQYGGYKNSYSNQQYGGYKSNNKQRKKYYDSSDSD
jgi:hypothetical protein